MPRGTETLLVVDDEEELLRLAKIQLESLGYRVLVASNGQQALSVLASEPRTNLLFSDVVMPGGMSGYELAEQATDMCPELKVLMVSGYEQQARRQEGLSRLSASRLTKPYLLAELSKRVRAVLDDVKLVD